MVSHVVLFRFRPDLTHTDRQGLARAFERALRDIPLIRSFRIGRRVTLGARDEQGAPDLHLAMIIDFDDVAGLMTYLDHPAHEDLGTRFNASVEQALVYNYELMGPEEARRVLGEI
jgi:hypothetical protein